MRELTHFDAEGRAVMVDVSAKPETDREATAAARVVMRPETLAIIRAGTAKQGDVLEGSVEGVGTVRVRIA